MAGGVTIKFDGYDKIVSKIKTLGSDVEQKADRIFQLAANQTRNKAVQRAPKDESGLTNSIIDRKVGRNYEVSVGRGYGVFQEFGTGNNFKPTPGYESYAAGFRGQRNTGPKVNPIDALTGWVHRKGLARGKISERSIAFLIYRSIKRHGVKAHPYMLPAFEEVKPMVIQDLKELIRDSIK